MLLEEKKKKQVEVNYFFWLEKKKKAPGILVYLFNMQKCNVNGWILSFILYVVLKW